MVFEGRERREQQEIEIEESRMKEMEIEKIKY